MKIAIDIDGVLADTNPALNDFYNKRHGTTLKVKDYFSHDLGKVWGCPEQEAVQIVEEFYQSPCLLRIHPLKGSVQGINALSKKHNLIAVTSRPEIIQMKTEEFISNYFGKKIDEIVSLTLHNFLAEKRSKYYACSSRGVDLLIEDCLETAIDCAEKGITSFLLNQPWNQLDGNYRGILPVNFIRFQNWLEIVEKLK